MKRYSYLFYQQLSMIVLNHKEFHGKQFISGSFWLSYTSTLKNVKCDLDIYLKFEIDCRKLVTSLGPTTTPKIVLLSC